MSLRTQFANAILSLAIAAAGCSTARSLADDVADEAADDTESRAEQEMRTAGESDSDSNATDSDSSPDRTNSRNGQTDSVPFGDGSSSDDDKYPYFDGVTEWTEQKAVNYNGDACGEAYIPLAGYDRADRDAYEKYREDVESTMARKILLMACPQHLVVRDEGQHPRRQAKRIGQLDMRKMHMEFDDRKFDHLNAALMTVYANLGYPMPDDMKQEDDWVSYALAGAAYGYGKRVDKEVLKDELTALDLPDGAVETFITLFESAIETFETKTKEEMSEGKWLVTFGVPARVVRERAENYEKYQEIYRRLDALKQQVNDALSGSADTYEVATQLADLRRDYLDTCDAPSACLMTPEYQRISRQFRMLYVGTQDLAGLYAERDAYNDPTQENHEELYNLLPVANHIYYQRRQIGYPMYHKYNDYKQAKEDGASEQAALAMVGGGPVLEDIVKVNDMHPDDIAMKDLGESLPGRAENKRATVANINRSDKTTRITFVKQTDTFHKPYDCVETNKIDRVTPDGRVIYRRNCKWRAQSSTSPEAEPITVPTYEAEIIESGDDVRFVVDTEGNAHIVRVFQKKGVAQLRDYEINKSDK